MPESKRHRDAATGAFTTAEDAAARPAETVAETVRRDGGRMSEPRILNTRTADADYA